MHFRRIKKTQALPRLFVCFLAGLLLALSGGLRAEDGGDGFENRFPDAILPPSAGNRYLAAEPVVDLRRDARPLPDNAAFRRPYQLDPFQETQLLYGEEVRVIGERGAWAEVEALEQPEFTHNQSWEGYPGWVPKTSLRPKPDQYQSSAVVAVRYAPLTDQWRGRSKQIEVPLGSRLSVLEIKKSWALVRRPGREDGWIRTKHLRMFEDFPVQEEELRRSLIRTAKMFIGEPYYWGGRCSYRPEETRRPTGVDCSGLVHLSYRVNGVDVPRDSHEQYLKSRPILISDIKPGDLIFLAKASNPNVIVHVMMSTGNDGIIEAVYEFDTVRMTTVERKLGKPLKDIAPFETVSDRVVYLGRFVVSE